MSEHTPGPWNLHSEVTDRESFVRECRAVAFDEATGKILRIASTDISIDIPAEEKKANARLISAAPEMLELLIKIRDDLSLWMDINGNEWHDSIDRVIEKATYNK